MKDWTSTGVVTTPQPVSSSALWVMSVAWSGPVYDGFIRSLGLRFVQVAQFAPPAVLWLQ